MNHGGLSRPVKTRARFEKIEGMLWSKHEAKLLLSCVAGRCIPTIRLAEDH